MKTLLYGTAMLLILFSGCISTQYNGKTFPAVNNITVIPFGGKAPAQSVYIGRGSASGEFSGTSREDLIAQLRRTGMQNGADFMLLAGSEIIPEGKIADNAENNFVIATDDPDQVAFELDSNEIIGNQNSAQTRFRSIMYALYYRSKH